MKLYYAKGACSLAVRIIINELGIACDYEAVNLKTKTTASGQDYLAINPKGAVPVIETDDGEILTENTVIQQYLADKYQATQLLPAVADFKRYRVLEWLNFITTELHKGCEALFSDKVPSELKEQVFKPLLRTKLQYAAQQVQSQSYLTGEQFTLPDAYLFVVLSWLAHLGIELSEFPNLKHYYTKLQQRPTVGQSLKEEG